MVGVSASKRLLVYTVVVIDPTRHGRLDSGRESLRDCPNDIRIGLETNMYSNSCDRLPWQLVVLLVAAT